MVKKVHEGFKDVYRHKYSTSNNLRAQNPRLDRPKSIRLLRLLRISTSNMLGSWLINNSSKRDDVLSRPATVVSQDLEEKYKKSIFSQKVHPL
jgi:hypothetical protein